MLCRNQGNDQKGCIVLLNSLIGIFESTDGTEFENSEGNTGFCKNVYAQESSTFDEEKSELNEQLLTSAASETSLKTELLSEDRSRYNSIVDPELIQLFLHAIENGWEVQVHRGENRPAKKGVLWMDNEYLHWNKKSFFVNVESRESNKHKISLKSVKHVHLGIMTKGFSQSVQEELCISIVTLSRKALNVEFANVMCRNAFFEGFTQYLTHLTWV
mmetsp:Transcript_27621/g.35892  ORF Transcript_27621/g.35892 Transcript_27621/m.35892 type:complete len:216 (+) Transcript_27621:179-826(+)